MDRWYAFRDRTVRNPAFQRWAARFPLTRPIARRRQRELFDLVAGFVYSQVLSACVRLKVLEALADGPRTTQELSSWLGLRSDATQKLLAAAAALRLVSERGPGLYGLGDLGAALLGNPGVAAMVEHHAILYDDLRDPVALLRGEVETPKLSAFWAYASTRAPDALSNDRVDTYSRLMAVSQDFIANEILDAYPLAPHKRLMDVGGGHGAFITAAAARAPHLAFTLVDLPAVAKQAEATFRAAKISDRATAVGADMFRDALPVGADVISLVRVLYDHDRARVLTLLRAARAALSEGGTLLVAEPMAGTPGAEAVGAAYFGFYLMAMKGGDARRPEEIAALIREAGFRDVKQVKTASPLLTGLLVARA
jgi:demethylspheroidene O-methyltransferase